ncbi:MAG: glycosyltransferase family 2 protein [Limisphaerales bacterium]
MNKQVSPSTQKPRVSVVVLNYNGLQWLPRCFDSLAAQTIFPEIEIILTDNNSADDSVKFTNEWLGRTGAKGCVVQNGKNLFYCGANNNGAATATGEFLLFLNNDTWLEPACLQNLYLETVKAGADGAAPLVQNYEDDTFQGGGDVGLDLFGCVNQGLPASQVQPTFAAPGMSLLIRADTFRKIGGFAPELLIYADETDLSWRVWISGGKIVSVPTARVHHRGAAVVNPEGKTKTVESRTTDFKRFLTNRNSILLLLKNCQHILLLLLLSHLFLLFVEAVMMLVLVRRWSYIRKAYLSAIVEAFKMRGHVREWRRRIRGFRRRGDFWMLRFLRLKPSRWDEVTRLFKFGPPKVDAK